MKMKSSSILLVLMLGCGPINIPPDFVDLVTCLNSCPGECFKVEGGYVCKPGQDPCAACPPGWECVDHKCIEPLLSCTETGCPGNLVCNADTGKCELPECEEGLVWNENIEACAVDCCTPDGKRRCAPPDIVHVCWNKPPGGEWSWIGESPQAGPCTPEHALEALDDRAPIYHNVVFQATTKLGPMMGVSFKKRIEAAAEEVRKLVGQCVIAGVEAIFIVRPDKTWEENHVAASNGGWANSGRGKYMGVHSSGPMPDGLLPDPREYAQYAKYNLTKHQGKWDRTLTLTRVLEYCQSIGMGTYGDLLRASCPVRPEGNDFRVWWEQQFGYYWECDGIPIEPTANPAQAYCTGHVKTCDAAQTICAEGDW